MLKGVLLLILDVVVKGVGRDGGGLHLLQLGGRGHVQVARDAPRRAPPLPRLLPEGELRRGRRQAAHHGERPGEGGRDDTSGGGRKDSGSAKIPGGEWLA